MAPRTREPDDLDRQADVIKEKLKAFVARPTPANEAALTAEVARYRRLWLGEPEPAALGSGDAAEA